MSKKIEVLCMHQNFPGQYRSLAPELNKLGRYNIRSLSIKEEGAITGIPHYSYNVTNGSNPGTHSLAQEFETKMIRAEAAALKCIEFKKAGYTPDIILGHPGWGETLLVKDVWPNVKLLTFFEFYYNSSNSDIDFDNTLDEDLTPPGGFPLVSKLTARNHTGLMALSQSDAIVSPTKFQASTAPLIFRDKINIIHDGVDTGLLKKSDTAFIEVTKDGDPDNKIRLTQKDKVLTFVNRNLEPYRGYHILMRALPEILDKHPDTNVLIVGGDGTSYGAAAPKGTTHKDIYYNKVKESLKGSNVRFVGRVPYNTLISMLSITTAHIYLTYPFVLSWSMLEAMSLESLIIGSKTGPVEELIENNKNGLLIDFLDHKQLAKTAIEVLDSPNDYNELRKNARNTIVENYDLHSICLPKHLQLIKSLQ